MKVIQVEVCIHKWVYESKYIHKIRFEIERRMRRDIFFVYNRRRENLTFYKISLRDI